MLRRVVYICVCLATSHVAGAQPSRRPAAVISQTPDIGPLAIALASPAVNSHEVRKGALIGGAVGAVLGVTLGAAMGTGCYLSSEPCDANKRRWQRMLGGGALGAALGAGIGALVGTTVSRSSSTTQVLLRPAP
jgi:hypothetical protein